MGEVSYAYGKEGQRAGGRRGGGSARALKKRGAVKKKKGTITKRHRPRVYTPFWEIYLICSTDLLKKTKLDLDLKIQVCTVTSTRCLCIQYLNPDDEDTSCAPNLFQTKPHAVLSRGGVVEKDQNGKLELLLLVNDSLICGDVVKKRV